MKTQRYTVEIDAPKEIVWQVMLSDKTYRIWTEVFCSGSHYIGDWSEGSKMLFLGPDESGKMGGMVSMIRENRSCDIISIEHIGIVNDDVEDTTSDAVLQWKGALEKYIFSDKDGNTKVLVEIDVADEYSEMFESMWPKALQKLKEVAEQYHTSQINA